MHTSVLYELMSVWIIIIHREENQMAQGPVMVESSTEGRNHPIWLHSVLPSHLEMLKSAHAAQLDFKAKD